MNTRPLRTARTAIPLLIGIALALVTSTAAAAGPTPSDPSQSTAQALQHQINADLRIAPGGTQINKSQISWHDGNVIMTFGPSASGPCPTGWACFYEHRDFNQGPNDQNGRRLQFRQCGFWQHFSTYAFNNQTSSWANTLNNWIGVNDDEPVTIQLWSEPPHSRSAYVGDAANDRADAFIILC